MILPALPLPPVLQGTETAPAPAPGGSAAFNPLLLMGALFAIMYFLMIRPERKRSKKRAEMLAAIRKNDRVVTTGGLHGTVAALGKTTVVVRVDENVRLKFNRDAIAAVLEPQEEETAGGGSA